MAIRAATSDSPAIKPEAVGTLYISAFERLILLQTATTTAPSANEKLFWKTIIHDKPRPIAEGRYGPALGKSLPATGSTTPTTAPITIAQTADVGSMWMPCVRRSATAFHI